MVGRKINEVHLETAHGMPLKRVLKEFEEGRRLFSASSAINPTCFNWSEKMRRSSVLPKDWENVDLFTDSEYDYYTFKQTIQITPANQLTRIHVDGPEPTVMYHLMGKKCNNVKFFAT